MPPKGFRLAWKISGIQSRPEGDTHIWQADSTDLYVDAIRAGFSNRLYAIGMSGYRLGVSLWQKPGYDAEKAAAEIRAITLGVRAWRTKRRIKARVKAEKEAALLADKLRRRASAKDDLHRIMTQRRWAIHHSFLDRARQLHGLHALPDDLADEAARIVKSTDETVSRATEDLNRPAPETVVAFCSDPKVRDAVAAALMKITETDADWATKKNHIGWSKTTTVKGHVLTMQETLTPNLAGHALALLHIHRTQVPDELRPALGMAAV